jgi:hypothetical protein
MPKAIRINDAGQIVSLDNPAKVSKYQHDDVLWIDTGGQGPWTITFDKDSDDPSTYPVAAGSPFSEDYYVIEKGASNGSTGGPVRGQVGRTYRYNVRKGKNADPTRLPITHDPDVDVES